MTLTLAYRRMDGSMARPFFVSLSVNGHAPFFRAIFSVFGDIERICSVFKPFSGSKVGGLDRSEWVDMLRFRHIFAKNA